MVERVQVDSADGVAVVRLDNPPHNVIDTSVRIALVEITARLAARADIGAVVVAGSDRAFAAGADPDAVSGMGQDEISNWDRALQCTFAEIAGLSPPVIAAIEGDALGGGLELALCADYRIAGERARFSPHELHLGVRAGGGLGSRLSGLVGVVHAEQLRRTERRVDSHEAAGIGLVNRVVAVGRALPEAVEFAAQLAADPRSAIRAIRSAVDQGLGGGPSEAGHVLERLLSAGLPPSRGGEVTR